ncbi:uncharacterized protein BO97DRAFT_451943 [Aspergillus homomorphus CBS 101889]|uniref:Uncharacterized protein n=1 Tax=Aspergillus homomorphus (strain CBS 101889) TaxID=1450537 RepID=A0A395HYM2_ASPHC|nr:hypothetical protein BO97DRAFT_451943 [Aspergillus homomorphus CBS 101889]RAL12555.1 hypothetical protein BO97DRAFT_451943 [Aspergillus homomorphus CBS 101889]
MAGKGITSWEGNQGYTQWYASYLLDQYDKFQNSSVFLTDSIRQQYGRGHIVCHPFPVPRLKARRATANHCAGRPEHHNFGNAQSSVGLNGSGAVVVAILSRACVSKGRLTAVRLFRNHYGRFASLALVIMGQRSIWTAQIDVLNSKEHNTAKEFRDARAEQCRMMIALSHPAARCLLLAGLVLAMCAVWVAWEHSNNLLSRRYEDIKTWMSGGESRFHPSLKDFGKRRPKLSSARTTLLVSIPTIMFQFAFDCLMAGCAVHLFTVKGVTPSTPWRRAPMSLPPIPSSSLRVRRDSPRKFSISFWVRRALSLPGSFAKVFQTSAGPLAASAGPPVTSPGLLTTSLGPLTASPGPLAASLEPLMSGVGARITH